MPVFAAQSGPVEVYGNELKNALQSGIKAVKIERHRIQIRFWIRGRTRALPVAFDCRQDAVKLFAFLANPLRESTVVGDHNSTPASMLGRRRGGTDSHRTRSISKSRYK